MVMFKSARLSEYELGHLTSNGVKRNPRPLNFGCPKICEIIRLTRSVPESDACLKELRR